MTKDKVYTPTEISDNALPGETTETDVSSSQPSSGGVYSSSETKDNNFPIKMTSVETLSSSLNTKTKKILAEYEFTQQGAIQVGKYDNGVSGDLRITPSGLTARDKAGITTFSLDAETGDAVFKGTVQAGTLIGGEVLVGDGHVVIDGDNRRIVVFDDDGIPRVFMGYQDGGF